jgi:hypothetical protein
MKRPWEVSRTLIARSDGQRRWVYAYQVLLHWAMEQGTGPEPVPSTQPEDHHEHRTLRSGLDPRPTTNPDD